MFSTEVGMMARHDVKLIVVGRMTKSPARKKLAFEIEFLSRCRRAPNTLHAKTHTLVEQL